MIEVGTKINSWTYLGPPKKKRNGYGRFRCDCGTEKDVDVLSIVKEKSRHCQCCRWNEFGLSKEDYRSILSARQRAIQRCYNEKNPSYYRYGPRGITVCKEWLEDNRSFAKWAVENGWQRGLSLDRIDNDGNYCPENCRWATEEEQARNKSSCIYIEHDGQRKCLMEWCEDYGVPHHLPLNRLNRGCTDFDKLFSLVDGRTGAMLHY